MRLLNANTLPLVDVQVASPRLVMRNIRGRLFAFDPQTLAVVQLDREDQFEKLKGGTYQPQIGGAYKPAIPDPVQRNGGKLASVVLNVTQTCNLNCTYCFLTHEYTDGLLDFNKGKMAFATAKRAIDELFDWSNPRKENQLGFFGGEPTLNWDCMVQAATYFREKCALHGMKRGGLAVTTNGTLLDRERIQWLDQMGFGMIVSFDGTPESQNKNRPFMAPILAKGSEPPRGSHDRVMETLELIRKEAPRLSRRITLRGTFPWSGRARPLIDDLKRLNDLVDAGYAGGTSLEPAILSESCAQGSETDLIRFQPERVFELYDEYMAIADWMIERYRAGQPAAMHQMRVFVQRLLYANHAWSECGAGANYGSVDAKGTVFGCHREQHSYLGTLEGGLDPAHRDKWVDNTTRERPHCRECDLQFTCGGGCREEAIGQYVTEHGLLPQDAIKLSYTTMCNFKYIWQDCALWIMSEVPTSQLVAAIPNPNGEKLTYIKKEMRKSKLTEILDTRTLRLPSHCIGHACDCAGASSPERPEVLDVEGILNAGANSASS